MRRFQAAFPDCKPGDQITTAQLKERGYADDKAIKRLVDSLKGGKAENTEYRFVSSLMELNKLTAEKRDEFIEFLSVNIKYFR